MRHSSKCGKVLVPTLLAMMLGLFLAAAPQKEPQPSHAGAVKAQASANDSVVFSRSGSSSLPFSSTHFAIARLRFDNAIQR